jgi:hypothetical protein
MALCPSDLRWPGWPGKQGNRSVTRHRGGWWRIGKGATLWIGGESNRTYRVAMGEAVFNPSGMAEHIAREQFAEPDVIAGFLDACAEFGDDRPHIAASWVANQKGDAECLGSNSRPTTSYLHK